MEMTVARGDAMSCDRPDTVSVEFSQQQVKNLVTEIQCQTSLHWNYCGLRSLPQELVEKGSHVEHIYLKCNSLTCLPDNFGWLSQLKFCYLNSNNLQSLPDSVGDLMTLQVLDVGNNKLTTLPTTLGRLHSLRLLVAVHNKLTFFPAELCRLQSLSILMLSSNKLTHLPEAMRGLTGLQGLYVDHNNLRKLPRSLAALPILTRISCCGNLLTHLPAVEFISRPKIFFDNNFEMNHLPLTLVRQLHCGDTWNSVVIQICGCFEESPIRNNKVYISLGKPVKHNETRCLMLPSLINRVTTCASSSATLPSLKELCLRLIWNEKQKCKQDPQVCQGYQPFFDLTSHVLPSSLCDVIDAGPVAYCDTPKCRAPLFTHVSCIVVPVHMSARVHLEGKVVPVVLYFCCDSCARQYTEDVRKMTDEFSAWLCRSLESACRVEFV